jgi:hypothetical protein
MKGQSMGQDKPLHFVVMVASLAFAAFVRG